MNNLRSLIIIIFGAILALTFSILVMIYGWGLQPRNWFWIIFVNIFGGIISQIIIQIGKGKQ